MREVVIESTKSVLSVRITQNGRPQPKIVDLLNRGDITLELCPNRYFNAALLQGLAPRFCSVTWMEENDDLGKISALALCQMLHDQGCVVLLHIGCRNLSETLALKILERLQEIGVRNILALQGESSRVNENSRNDFRYASDFVAFIRANFHDYFCIAVAGYPEKHPRAESKSTDLNHLKRKVLTGADFIVTQATFDYYALEEFCVACKELEINVPIVPGFFVITSSELLLRMSKICGIPVPKSMVAVISKNQGHNERIKEYGLYLAVEFVKQFWGQRSESDMLKGLHIFTLNNLGPVTELRDRLFCSNYCIERPL